MGRLSDDSWSLRVGLSGPLRSGLWVMRVCDTIVPWKEDSLLRLEAEVLRSLSTDSSSLLSPER